MSDSHLADVADVADLADLAELAVAHGRLLACVTEPSRLDEQAARAPSELPGWSRGHVLTHLARNADGLGNLVRWATTGQPIPMYSSPAAREADIASGSGRSGHDLIRDLAEASSRIQEQLSALSAAALDAVVEIGPARIPTRGAELISMRVREVEIHLVDLDLGYQPANWSNRFAHRTLSQLLPRLATQGAMPVAWLAATDSGTRWLAGGPDGGAELCGPAFALLGWLTGRIPAQAASEAGLELLGGGDVPSPPAWT